MFFIILLLLKTLVSQAPSSSAEEAAKEAYDIYLAQAWQAWKIAHPDDRQEAILDSRHAQFVDEARSVAYSSSYFDSSQFDKSRALCSPNQNRITCGNTCACFALANAIASTEKGGYNPFEAEWLATKIFNTVKIPLGADPKKFKLPFQDLSALANSDAQRGEIRTKLVSSPIIFVDAKELSIVDIEGIKLPKSFLGSVARYLDNSGERKHLEQELSKLFLEQKNIESIIKYCEDSKNQSALLKSTATVAYTLPAVGNSDLETIANWCSLLKDGKGALIVHGGNHYTCMDVDLKRDRKNHFIYRNSLQPFDPTPPPSTLNFLDSIRNTNTTILLKKAKTSSPRLQARSSPSRRPLSPLLSRVRVRVLSSKNARIRIPEARPLVDPHAGPPAALAGHTRSLGLGPNKALRKFSLAP